MTIRQQSTNKTKGSLTGVRVIDMTRLAPGPYCTMLLADLGADVIVVGGGRSGLPIKEFAGGKKHVSLDLKKAEGRGALHALVRNADVFIEGFRPGVAGRIGAGYAELAALNPKLVYCSLTGYGQDGPRAQEAGHDINYAAITGVLGSIGPADRPPTAPLNIIADFAGGSMLAALGILAALLERRESGKGQYIDAAMIDGCLSLMAMHFPLWGTQTMPGRGDGLIAGNVPFYRCYVCGDGKYVSVGALERAFFVALWQGLELGEPPDHMDTANWPLIEKTLTEKFLSKTRDEWSKIFAGSDACVAPVLAPDEVWADPQISHRHPKAGPQSVPAIPRMSKTPSCGNAIDLADRSWEVLQEVGLSDSEIDAAIPDDTAAAVSGLVWPPKLKGRN